MSGQAPPWSSRNSDTVALVSTHAVRSARRTTWADSVSPPAASSRTSVAASPGGASSRKTLRAAGAVQISIADAGGIASAAAQQPNTVDARVASDALRHVIRRRSNGIHSLRWAVGVSCGRYASPSDSRSYPIDG